MTKQETKHTLGPWTAQETEAHFGGSGVLSETLSIGPRLGSLAIIIPDGRLSDEDRANARLIAAAPDMLEALADALGFAAMYTGRGADGRFSPDVLDENGEPDADKVADKARAALAKARGGGERGRNETPLDTMSADELERYRSEARGGAE